MIKTKTLHFIFLSLLLSSFQWVSAQDDVIEKLKDQFEHVATQSLREKLYVQTDKNFYTTGETIWFKVYAVDGIFNKPLDLSKTVYVEMIDENRHPLLQGKIPMNESTGSGSFIVPASIRSDNYVFRAYTNWMKNDGPNLFFEKTLTVINSLKKPDWVSIRESYNDYDIQFLPEGGQLVNGLESVVAFKAVDSKGKGLNCKGFLLDQNDDTVAHFRTLRFGMGRFSFLPLKGNNYRAYIQLENGILVAGQFPRAMSTGFVMKCEDQGNQLLIRVASNAQKESSYVYILANTRKVIKKIEAATILNGNAEFRVDKNILGEGVSDIIIFDNELKPVCERLYFKRPGESLQIQLNANKNEYAKRQEVKLDLQTTDALRKSVNADLSMSVYLVDSVQTHDNGSIRNYLWLSSELTGFIEDANYYFTSTDPEAGEVADDLMLTQGWRKFNGKDQIQNSTPEFIPETDGSFLAAKIVKKPSGMPAIGIPVYLSVPGKRYYVTTAISNTKGELKFNVNNVYGSSEVIVQPVEGKDSGNYRVEITDPFLNDYSSRKVPAFFIGEKFASQLLNHSLSSEVQNAYFAKEQQLYSMSSFSDSTAFFGKPDKKYFLDDYTRFKTMEEVMREYVPEVRLRKKDGEFHYMVKNLPYQQAYFDEDPLILLDGVPVFKADGMISYDPLKVSKMEIVTHTFYTGPVAHRGIVSYTTYDGSLDGFKLSYDAVVADFNGFLYRRTFYQPKYETEQQLKNRLPDFRNVLDWEPQLRTDGEGKHSLSFYTSDLPGNFVIVVEGITKEGLCGTVSKFITVKK